MSEVKPFLTSAGAPTSTRTLATALPALEVPVAPSPWTPKPAPEPPAPPPPSIDVAAVRAEAAEQGRAEGLRETEALRARLRELIEELITAKAALVTPAAELIADAATAVIAAWTERSDRRELFAPIVRGWLARCDGEATAHVHPSEVDAMRAAVGDAAIAVVGDDAVPRGGVKLHGAALELSHAWEPRLRELRETIATAIEDPLR